MAKIVMEFDTETKVGMIKKDNQELEDVKELHLYYMGDDESENELYTIAIHCACDEMEGMREHNSLYAAKMKEYADKNIVQKAKEVLLKLYNKV